MRRYAPAFFAVIIGLFIIVPAAFPLIAHATGIPYWGPLVPPDGSPNQGNVCPDAWGNVLQLINNVIALSITILIIFAAPLLIAYSGFLYLTSGANPSARGQANKVLTSTIIGIVVALAGYIIVDAVLTSLTYQGVSGWTSQVFSNGASTCLKVAQSLNSAQFPSGSTSCASGLTCQNSQCLPAPTKCNGGATTCSGGTVCGSDGQTCVYPAGVTCGGTTCSPNQTCGSNNQCVAVQACSAVVPGPGSTAGGSTAQCSSSNSACSVSTLQADGLSSPQANVMSCIAVTESSGNPSTPPYNQTHPGSNSSACGTFQITQTTWNGTASGACANWASNCENAACNAQVAATLVSQSGYSSWTCAGCNSKAASCVQTYSGGS